MIQKFPDVHKFQINLEDIQPSQFYVDRDKKRAVASFTETEEAVKRNILTPYDMEELPHDEYEIKWNKFCEEF